MQSVNQVHCTLTNSMCVVLRQMGKMMIIYYYNYSNYQYSDMLEKYQAYFITHTNHRCVSESQGQRTTTWFLCCCQPEQRKWVGYVEQAIDYE